MLNWNMKKCCRDFLVTGFCISMKLLLRRTLYSRNFIDLLLKRNFLLLSKRVKRDYTEFST